MCGKGADKGRAQHYLVLPLRRLHCRSLRGRLRRAAQPFTLPGSPGLGRHRRRQLSTMSSAARASAGDRRAQTRVGPLQRPGRARESPGRECIAYVCPRRMCLHVSPGMLVVCFKSRWAANAVGASTSGPPVAIKHPPTRRFPTPLIPLQRAGRRKAPRGRGSAAPFPPKTACKCAACAHTCMRSLEAGFPFGALGSGGPPASGRAA